MLFPVSFEYDDRTADVTYFNPKLISCVIDPDSRRERVHIWIVGHDQFIELPVSINEVAGLIENCYNKSNESSPFQYINQDIFLNPHHVAKLESCHVDDAAAGTLVTLSTFNEFIVHAGITEVASRIHQKH